MSFAGFSDQVDPDKTIKNMPFWPDLNLSKFQADYRLPAEYRASMLEDRLKLAMVWANGELAAWKTEQETAEAASLGEVPVQDAPAWGSPLVLLYVRAVSCRAKALLLEDYATVMRKSDAVNDVKESEDTVEKWHRMAVDAINDLQGKPKIHAELL